VSTHQVLSHVLHQQLLPPLKLFWPNHVYLIQYPRPQRSHSHAPTHVKLKVSDCVQKIFDYNVFLYSLSSFSLELFLAAVYQVSPGFDEMCINPRSGTSLVSLPTCSAISSNIYSTPTTATSVSGTGTVAHL
jgi:hypothetical protein